jgi:hypothetical protein
MGSTNTTLAPGTTVSAAALVSPDTLTAATGVIGNKGQNAGEMETC